MANARSEVNSMIRELNSIIRELSSISAGLRSQANFKGIGSERCAASIDGVVSNCNKVRKSLQNMDMNTLAEGFSGGGGGGGGGRGF